MVILLLYIITGQNDTKKVEFMRYCINCGNELGDTKFCTKCGTKVPDETAASSSGTRQKRFCSNCGTEMGDEQFCINCGAKATDNFIVQNYSRGNDVGKTKNNGKGILTTIIVIVLICAIGIGGFWVFGGRSYKSLIKTYVDASMAGDAKKLVSLLPEGRIQYMVDSWYDDKDAIIEDLQEDLYDSLSQIKNMLGNNYKVSYNILDERDYKGSEFAEFKEDYLNEYDTKISAAKELTIELVVSAKGQESSKEVTFTVIKVGRSWYISGLDV